MDKIPQDLKELLEAGAHFGHQARRWNPKMKPFIYDTRAGVHIFDLTITAQKLNEACEFVKQSVADGKIVVFIGTKRQAKAIVREEAVKAGAPFVSERWLGGMITNWEELSKRIKKLGEMKQKMETGGYDRYTKKEKVLIKREIDRLERLFGGVSELQRIPDVLVIIDTLKERAAVKEAIVKDMKIVAMLDSNCDPDPVNYPIPANDDAVRSIKYVVSRLAEAFAEGKSKIVKAVNLAPVANKAVIPASKPVVGQVNKK